MNMLPISTLNIRNQIMYSLKIKFSIQRLIRLISYILQIIIWYHWHAECTEGFTDFLISFTT